MMLATFSVLLLSSQDAVRWAQPREYFNVTGISAADTNRKLPWEQVATHPDEITFAEHPSTPRVYHASGEVTTTYYSTEWKLLPGEVVCADPGKTVMPMPEGKVAITSIKADIVDVNKKPVPLDEVYLHHWIMLDKAKPNSGVCGGFLRYIFGVGAETRNTAYDFPQFNGDIYGWLTEAERDRWTANIHVLRTVNIDPEQGGLKGCIECHGPNKWCKTKGGFECCPNKARCPTVTTGGPSDDAKSYFFRYEVTHIPQDAEKVKQGANFILDVSHPSCAIEYNIPANDKGYNVATVTATLPFDARIFQMWGHIHIAGYNITLYHGKDATAPKICTSNPTYGTKESVPGNELGYITAMSKCKYLKEPYIIKKGEKITLEATYNVGEEDDRTWNTGYHDGVMGLWFMTGAKCESAGCTDEGPLPEEGEQTELPIEW